MNSILFSLFSNSVDFDYDNFFNLLTLRLYNVIFMILIHNSDPVPTNKGFGVKENLFLTVIIADWMYIETQKEAGYCLRYLE